MSGLVMGLVWELPIEGEFGRAEKFILLAYADHCDQNGMNIYPSIDLVARKTGYAERAVQMATRTLEKLGLLMPAGMGPHGTNRYSIPVERTDGGAKIAPCAKNAPAEMSKNAPEENAPEENAPEPVVVVKESSSASSGESSQKNSAVWEPSEKPNIFRLYESNFGALTPILADILREAEKEYPQDWLEYAFQEAVKNNKRSWKYAEAILKRIKVDGFMEATHAKDKLPAAKGKTSSWAKRAGGDTPGGAAPTAASRTAAERINARRRERQNY
jgi:DnaD/phage-associated family protein